MKELLDLGYATLRAQKLLTNFRKLDRSKRERERCYPSLRKVSLEASRVLYAANTSKI
jgi:hypothetical protein